MQFFQAVQAVQAPGSMVVLPLPEMEIVSLLSFSMP